MATAITPLDSLTSLTHPATGAAATASATTAASATAATVEIRCPQGWVAVCTTDDLTPGRGVAALLPDGTQAALFADRAGQTYAIANRDPFTGAQVLSRGLTGSADGRRSWHRRCSSSVSTWHPGTAWTTRRSRWRPIPYGRGAGSATPEARRAPPPPLAQGDISATHRLHLLASRATIR